MDQQSIQAIRIQIRATKGAQEQDVSQSSSAPQPAEAHPAGEEQVDDAEVDNMETCTTSTNTADDFAHRGAHLQTLRFYV